MTDAWDVFHSETLSVDRAVPDATVRARLQAGTLTPDDLVRPAGTTRWSRIEQVAALNQDPPADPEPPLALLPLVLSPEPESEPETEPKPVPEPELPAIPVELPPVLAELEFPDALSTVEFAPIRAPEPIELSGSLEAAPVFLPPPPPPRPPIRPEPSGSVEAAPVFQPPPPADRPSRPAPDGSAVVASPVFAPIILLDDDDEDEVDEDKKGPLAHPGELGDPEPRALAGSDAVVDDPASEFTLTRGRTDRVEELDLAAMVDVAFQLVLFFLVTASTVVFKTLEIPKPSEDKPPEVAAQSRAKTLDELEKDFILLEIDAEGNFRVDHLPVARDRAALTEKLRQARETTDRRALLLSTDPATRHRVAVLASDIAREINLEVSWAKTASP